MQRSIRIAGVWVQCTALGACAEPSNNEQLSAQADPEQASSVEVTWADSSLVDSSLVDAAASRAAEQQSAASQTDAASASSEPSGTPGSAPSSSGLSSPQELPNEGPVRCETRAHCPADELGVRWGCYAVDCGPKHCRQSDPPCAAPDTPALVCGCDGLTAQGNVGCGTGWPASYAYALPGYWCTSEAEDCEGFNVLGLECDPASPPQVITRSFSGSGLTDLEGAQLIVRYYGVSELQRVEGGAVELQLRNVGDGSERPHVVIDDNEDGLCSSGELALPYSQQLDALRWHLQFVVSGDSPRPVCTAW